VLELEIFKWRSSGSVKCETIARKATMIYFIIFKNKKDNDYRMYTNIIFNNEKEADDFGKRSMKRGFEHKVVEYNDENFKRYWYK